MKKKLLPILLFVMFIPFEVGAKEYCKVVSGNGKDIGSEIACGTEHFYIIDSNEDEIKMLAKYNLLVGSIIEREVFAGNSSSYDCYNYAKSKGATSKIKPPYDNKEGYCFLEYPIDVIETKQSEDAISAHWDENDNYLYPQKGDVYITNFASFAPSDTTIIDFRYAGGEEKYDNYFYDLSVGNGDISSHLNNYKEYMLSKNYEINNVDLLSLDEVNTMVKNSNKTLPYAEWHSNTSVLLSPHYEFGSLIDLLSDNQRFIYNTTYWIKNGYGLNTSNGLGLFPINIIFINSRGGICAAPISHSSGLVSGCYPYVNDKSYLGAGVRPVITISNELEYLIKTETDGNGTIDVIENSLGGEIIQFKVSANKGYKLGSIIIKTDSGEEVEFSKGEITKNDDGSFSLDKNKFTMPFENVTIQAKIELENILKNPKTGYKVMYIILTLVTSIGMGTFIFKKKESRYNV